VAHAQEQAFHVFPEDSALELGGDEASSYLIAYTSDKALVKEESAFLLGKDIPDLQGISPYAHLVFVLLDEEKEAKDQQLYRRITEHRIRPLPCLSRRFLPPGQHQRAQRRRNGSIRKPLRKAFRFGDLANCFSKAYHQDSTRSFAGANLYYGPRFPLRGTEKAIHPKRGHYRDSGPYSQESEDGLPNLFL
jgi:hypothetical protein